MFQSKWKKTLLRWVSLDGYWLCQKVIPGNKVVGPIGVGKTKDEAFENWKAAHHAIHTATRMSATAIHNPVIACLSA